MTGRHAAWILTIALMLAAAGAASGGEGGSTHPRPDVATTTAPVADLDPAEARARRRTPVVDVFETCRNAVVNISSTRIVTLRSSSPFDQLFGEFFDMPARPRVRQYRRESVGSGFVLHPSGYLVTNAHVVARTAERRATFADGREHDAKVIAIDPQHDLAVLKIEADASLQPLPLGDSDDLMVGETVVAIGNPLGYQHTVTAGVVSALDRQLELRDDVAFEGLIQTDASINPGNSGGPLLNILGELVGINTAIRADAQNIGFAIPVNQLRDLLPEMLDVERRYGITTGVRVEDGDGVARIREVQPESPAAEAGLRPGQSIAAVDDEPVRSRIDFHIALIDRRPGDRLRLALRDGDQPLRRVLTLGERPRPDGAKLLRERLGVVAQRLDARMARALGIARLRGLLVETVEPDSPAARVGLQRGDVIVQLGRHQPESLEDVGELLEQLEPGQRIAVAVLRVSGRTIYRLSAALTVR